VFEEQVEKSNRDRLEIEGHQNATNAKKELGGSANKVTYNYYLRV
jgi:hypothetical protein